MLVNELLVERRLQRTRIMYHGTSSVFLPSIMKHGLIPDPPQQAWGADNLALQSFGGVYLSQYEETAFDAALNASDKFGGDQVLIRVIYVSGSGAIDEDLVFNDLIKIGVQEFNKNEFVNLNSYLLTILSLAASSIQRNTNVNITYKTKKLINEFYIKMYYILYMNKNIKMVHQNTKTREIIPRDFIVARLKRNENLRNILDNMLSSTKDYSTTSEVRVRRPIGFKGKTRIIGIKQYTSEGEELTIYDDKFKAPTYPEKEDPNYPSAWNINVS